MAKLTIINESSFKNNRKCGFRLVVRTLTFIFAKIIATLPSYINKTP